MDDVITAKEEKCMPGFMTYREAALMYSLIPDEEAGKAVKAAAKYYLYGDVDELTGVSSEVFQLMRSSIDRGRLTYKAECEGGKRGANKRYRKTPEE